MPLRNLVEADKALPYAPEWSEPDAGGLVRLSSALEIGGVTEAALVLTTQAYRQHPDEHVSFELAVLDHGGARRIRLVRLDWRSLKGGHSNNRRKCSGPWGGKRVPDTHLHSFELNWVEAEQRMKGGKLPCAEPIEQPLETFEHLRGFVGRCFRINNIALVPMPDWAYDLFA